MTAENAATFLDAGASHVIVTSYVFREGGLDQEDAGRGWLIGDEHIHGWCGLRYQQLACPGEDALVRTLMNPHPEADEVPPHAWPLGHDEGGAARLELD